MEYLLGYSCSPHAHMALPNSPGSPGAGKPNPSVIDLGTIFVDSDIIFGFTSHLLKRKTKVRVSSERR